MPIHDWTRVDAALFHHFHQSWTVALSDALNAGGLPSEYFVLVEQRIQRPIPGALRQGVHLLVIDLFPLSPRDPQGLAKAIWDQFEEKELELPPDKNLSLMFRRRGIGRGLRGVGGRWRPAAGNTTVSEAGILCACAVGTFYMRKLGDCFLRR